MVYRDGRRVLTRKWNVRDCEECKIAPGSTHIALFSELPLLGLAEEVLIESTLDTVRLLQRYCGGTVSAALWRASSRTITNLAL